ncbi:HOMEOBOX LEUCINE ZIPPER PROTEIN [Salix koriyanagi]|uniref:HOMEOBOX LEUCINE ZIPPER PROTEIN n=1 Tax=Salix koriyanagi TaxID=2511006 RepID=A0A9Q1AP99_9ROSI|nr:HOMEOBOX LEUCINE ZIPPER PROTEIN [Salix koriyanagi]
MVRTRQGTRTESPSFERSGGSQGAQGWQDEGPLDDTASHVPMILPEILQREARAARNGGRPNQTEGVPPVAAEDEEFDSANTKSGSENQEGGSDDEQDPRPKRKRYHRHTQHQIQEMEAFLKECLHPDNKQRK